MFKIILKFAFYTPPSPPKYNITDDAQFPDISRFDPVAKIIGIRPGQVCEIIRPSKTAIDGKYYRICI